MVEQTVNMPIADAYNDLKAHLKEQGCKTLSETPPSNLTVKQGSLWGVTPRSAKKIVTCSLNQTAGETKICCSSKLSRDWVNLTVAGTALAVVVVGLCLWMSADLTVFLGTAQPNTWSWIASTGDYIDYPRAEAFINLTNLLAIFLSAIIAAEAAIAFYARSRIDQFAKSVLSAS